jgi:import inner membrane translocase subunit TIM44
LYDPSFTSETFLTEARNYILPEIIESWLKGDLPTLRMWMAEPMYNMISELILERQRQGLKVEYKILDLRGVDIVAGKMIDERPVLFLTANVQQITFFRDLSGKIVSGKEDDIQRVLYVFAMTRDLVELKSSPTYGWKVMEMSTKTSGSMT